MNSHFNHVMRDIEMNSLLTFKGISEYYGSYEDEDYYYVIKEIIDGRLIDYLKDHVTTERIIIEIIKPLLEILMYLNDNKIIYRYLNLNNIYLKSINDLSSICLNNFSYSHRIGEYITMSDCNLQIEYVAPEIIEQKEYDYGVDIWSIGVICYILFCGHAPFRGNGRDIFYQIRHGIYKFESPEFDQVSENAKSFIRSSLHVNKQKRLNIKQAVTHSFITKEGNDYNLNYSEIKLSKKHSICKIPSVSEMLIKMNSYKENKFTNNKE